jgi:hypothetical protein
MYITTCMIITWQDMIGKKMSQTKNKEHAVNGISTIVKNTYLINFGLWKSLKIKIIKIEN